MLSQTCHTKTQGRRYTQSPSFTENKTMVTAPFSSTADRTTMGHCCFRELVFWTETQLQKVSSQRILMVRIAAVSKKVERVQPVYDASK